MINVFDFDGPRFLAFYFVLGCLCLVIVKLIVASQKGAVRAPLPAGAITDPFEIAMLRGGASEAIRVACFSLLDRGLLEERDSGFRVKDVNLSTHARRGIEKAILKFFSATGALKDCLKNDAVRYECDKYDSRLISAGLLMQKNQTMHFGVGAIILLLLGVGIAKLGIALSRGHTNVAFLILLTCAFVYFATAITKNRRTYLGHKTLGDLETLFDRLKLSTYSLKPGGATNEATLLVAVYGLDVLPGSTFKHSKAVMPRNQSGSGWDNSSCGTTCGSSCGSSCGGGCGGGCCGCGS